MQTRSHRRGPSVLVALMSIAVAACGAPAPSPGLHALPVTTYTGTGCRGVGVDASLSGDPADPSVAWLVMASGQRENVIFPPGYMARFTPELEVINAHGVIVGHQGTPITGGCVTGPDAGGPLLILLDSSVLPTPS